MSAQSEGIRKRFVTVNGRLVHFRTAGSGPPVVLLHDSPHSSRLHLPLIGALSDRFTVIAFDTPGYGGSEPLHGNPLRIGDFAIALKAALDALGVPRAGFYGFHTSSKIVMDFAIRFPEAVNVAIMDGLSLPEGGPDPMFISRYMRPFQIDADGEFIGREWTRVRDTLRWFPWFDHRPATRGYARPAPTPEHVHNDFLDFFQAGPNYIDAYEAAMSYVAAPRLSRVTAPTVIMARSNDVLYSYLDKLPDDLPPNCTVERLGPDRDAWAARIGALFSEHARDAAPAMLGVGTDGDSAYLDLAHGQLRIRRYGPRSGRPIIYLPELPGGAAAAEDFLQELGDSRSVVALDLPGYGESDALPAASAEAFVDVIEAAIRHLSDGPVDLIAEGTATPLALRLMAARPDLVRRAVLDAVLLPDADARAELQRNYCPSLAFEFSGAHVHRGWHMLRDQEAQWPWYDLAGSAARKFPGRLEALPLYRRLLDVLAQPGHYGDAVNAAFSCDGRADLATIDIPLLITQSDDPRDQWAALAAREGAAVSVVSRVPDLPRRAVSYLDFLSEG